MTADGRRWSELERGHREAVETFIASAARVPSERWTVPPAPQRWSAGEIATHLTLVYEVGLRELETGVGPRVVTAWWMRAALYFTVRRRLLAGAPFPRVRAPREARPVGEHREKEVALELLRVRATAFEHALRDAATRRPRTRLTHPYLGRFSLAEALRFTALHVRHHERQIAALVQPATG